MNKTQTVFWYIAIITCTARPTLSHNYSLQVRSEITGKLFFQDDVLTIVCELQRDGTLLDIEEASPGLDWNTTRPHITIANRSYHEIFTPQQLTNESTQAHWLLELPRLRLTNAKEYILPKEQWTVTVELDVGETTLNTKASLLDTGTEPILQWDLGEQVPPRDVLVGTPDLYQHVSSPCAPDVVLVVHQMSSNLAVGVSHASFRENSTSWYELDLCSELIDCDAGNLLDVTLTNVHMIISTTRGLFVSNDLTHFHGNDTEYPELNHVIEWKYIRIDRCPYLKTAHLKYTKNCLFRAHDPFPADVVLTTCTCQNDERVILRSSGNFTNWISVEPDEAYTHVHDVAYNAHRNTYTWLYESDERTKTVTQQGGNLAKGKTYMGPRLTTPFAFPLGSNVTRLDYHPLSHALFAHGTSIWNSDDVGCSFQLYHRLENDDVTNHITFSYNKNTMLIHTENGHVLYGKLGVERLMNLGKFDTKNYTIVTIVDYDGLIWTVSLNDDHSNIGTTLLNITEMLDNAMHSLPHPLLLQQMSTRKGVLFEYIPSGVRSDSVNSTFGQNNIGQVISMDSGGYAIINEVNLIDDTSNFVTEIWVTFVEPFTWEVSSLLEHMVLRMVVISEKQAMVSLLDTESNMYPAWQSSHMYTTIAVPFQENLLVTEIINSTHVVATSYIELESNIVTEVPPRTWLIYDLGLDAGGQALWTLREDKCRHELVPDLGLKELTVFELDMEDKISLYASNIGDDPLSLSDEPHLQISVSNPLLFRTDYFVTLVDLQSVEKFTMNIAKQNTEKGITSYTISNHLSSLHCETASMTFIVYAGCPCRKRLVYLYPIDISKDDFLYGNPTSGDGAMIADLYPNYRPPSELGVAIPTSDNIYNADPSASVRYNRFQVSKQSGRYKQCANKANRSECGCTDDMKLSDDAAVSDCKEKVYRLHHPGVLYPEFKVEQPNRETTSVSVDANLLVIWDINERIPTISHVKTTELLDSVLKNQKLSNSAILHSPSGVKIMMVKSGLYHFRAELAGQSSFCKLYAEFQVFVDTTPIAYPVQHILRFTMAFVIGGLFFLIYLWYLSTHHTHRFRTEGPQCLELVDMVNVQGVYKPSDYQQIMKDKVYDMEPYTDDD